MLLLILKGGYLLYISCILGLCSSMLINDMHYYLYKRKKHEIGKRTYAFTWMLSLIFHVMKLIYGSALICFFFTNHLNSH